jgi:hypothetical protein
MNQFKSLTSGESFPYANIEAFYGEISLSVSPHGSSKVLFRKHANCRE